MATTKANKSMELMKSSGLNNIPALNGVLKKDTAKKELVKKEEPKAKAVPKEEAKPVTPKKEVAKEDAETKKADLVVSKENEKNETRKPSAAVSGAGKTAEKDKKICYSVYFTPEENEILKSAISCRQLKVANYLKMLVLKDFEENEKAYSEARKLLQQVNALSL